MKRTIISLLLTALILPLHAKKIVWFDGTNPVTYSVQKNTDLVVGVALNMFSDDMLEVTETYAIPASPTKAKIHIYQLDKATDTDKKELTKQGFNLNKLTKSTDASLSVATRRTLLLSALTVAAQHTASSNSHAWLVSLHGYGGAMLFLKQKRN